MTSKDNNILPEEEYCHYSGLPLAKSMFRICAGSCLLIGDILLAGLLLIIAEFLGIVEEF